MDVMVIGAGLAGLTAARTLQRTGKTGAGAGSLGGGGWAGPVA